MAIYQVLSNVTVAESTGVLPDGSKATSRNWPVGSFVELNSTDGASLLVAKAVKVAPPMDGTAAKAIIDTADDELARGEADAVIAKAQAEADAEAAGKLAALTASKPKRPTAPPSP